jgi:hypothetical protein
MTDGLHFWPRVDNDAVLLEFIIVDKDVRTSCYSPTAQDVANACGYHGINAESVLEIIHNRMRPGTHTLLIDAPEFKGEN